MSEEFLLDQIFGEGYKGKYPMAWCDLCDGFYIIHGDHGSENDRGCAECEKDFEDFNNLKTDIFLYLSEEEIFAFEKIRRLKQIIKICVYKDIELIDWAELEKRGELSERDRDYFPELKEGEWKQVSRNDFPADAKNNYSYSFINLERVKNI